MDRSKLFQGNAKALKALENDKSNSKSNKSQQSAKVSHSASGYMVIEDDEDGGLLGVLGA